MKLRPEQETQAVVVLQNLPLFVGCSPAFMVAMIKILEFKELGPSKVVLMDQEIARTLFILVKGSVGVWKRVGGEKKQLATLKAPDFFGERSMFEESPASALVKTVDACQLYSLDRPSFDPVATQFPGVLDIIRKNVADVRLKRMGPELPKKEEPSGA